MIERRRREVGLTGPIPEEFPPQVKYRQRLRQRFGRQWPQNALRLTGRARRVKEGRTPRLVRDRGGGKSVRRLFQIADSAAFAGAVDDQTELDLGTGSQGLN